MSAMSLPTLRTMRILVVEDDANLRALYRSLLESLGHEVDESTNAQDALAMLMGDHEIELVILDLGLPPVTDGFSEGIRFLNDARKHNAHLKVIVASSQSQNEALLRCVEAGAFDILTKPFTKDGVTFAIHRAQRFIEAERRLRGLDRKFPVMVVADATTDDALRLARDEVMERLIRSVLFETRHNVSEASRRLNVTREQLYYYLKKFGIDRPAED
ncbi:MAG: response regulator [Betaproteobacteria bacterium]|nr:response regulator [Betaproteobacteria bacterium]NBT75244.1 response regulator [Betaproteobacteria bacterium]NCA16888.1 response regulator [Betaproteobacteria bacterium]